MLAVDRIQGIERQAVLAGYERPGMAALDRDLVRGAAEKTTIGLSHNRESGRCPGDFFMETGFPDQGSEGA